MAVYFDCFMTNMNCARDEEAARTAMGAFRQLEFGEDLVVVYSPLERTKAEPDVVLICQGQRRKVKGSRTRSVIPDPFSGFALFS